MIIIIQKTDTNKLMNYVVVMTYFQTLLQSYFRMQLFLIKRGGLTTFVSHFQTVR